MVQIASNQAAQVPGILARASATTLMNQELDAIDVPKNRCGWERDGSFHPLRVGYGIYASFPITSDEFRHLRPIFIGTPKSKLFLQGVFQHFDVSVLAKYQ